MVGISSWVVAADEEVAGAVLPLKSMFHHRTIKRYVGRCDHIEVTGCDHSTSIDAGRSAADQHRPGPVFAS